MAQQQQNLTIVSPGMYGINTEDSELAQDPSFAKEALNAVIDQSGQLASRRNFRNFWGTGAFGDTTDGRVFLANAVTTVTGETTNTSGFEYLTTVANGETERLMVGVFKHRSAGSGGDVTNYRLVGEHRSNGQFIEIEVNSVSLEAALGASADFANIKAVEFAGSVFFYGPLIRPFVWTPDFDTWASGGGIPPTVDTATFLDADANWLPPQDDGGNIIPDTYMNGGIVAAAYGRLWMTGLGVTASGPDAADYQTIYYSDLLEPARWYDGKAVPTVGTNTAGVLNIGEYWPNGEDKIVALVAHNNLLLVFGRNNILVFGNPQGDPAAIGGIYLADTIEGIGCVHQNAMCSIGTDLLFVDTTGVRSLGRTIQEQSAEVGSVTRNVRRDITGKISNQISRFDGGPQGVSLTYWPSQSMVVCLFTTLEEAYTMDLRLRDANGNYRITRWDTCPFKGFVPYNTEGTDRIMSYAEANADLRPLGTYTTTYTTSAVVTPFTFRYESNPLTFGQSANLKFPKRIDYTLRFDGTIVSTVDWNALWGVQRGSLSYSRAITSPADETIERRRVNAKGAGDEISIGMTFTEEYAQATLYEINIQTTLGRIY